METRSREAATGIVTDRRCVSRYTISQARNHTASNGSRYRVIAERADSFIDAVGVGLAVPNLPLICRALRRSDGARASRLFVAGERTFRIALQRQDPRENHRVLDRHRSTLPKKGKHRVCRVSE